MKSELRKLYKSIRNRISPSEKNTFDNRIFTLFINSELYKKAEKLLFYISFGSEVDTVSLIDYALKDGKNVAVPYCNGNKMEFYAIDSLDCLTEGRFGIPTVVPCEERLVRDFAGYICVVPALSFDKSGNRLGYGGGFYDRFMSSQNIPAVGLAYERCIHSELPAEEHDMNVDYILTENRFEKL